MAAGANRVESAAVIDQIKNKDDIPTMRDLNRYVVRKFASSWKDLGIELGLQFNSLNIIEKNHPNQVEDCIQEMTHNWLKSTPIPTWRSLEVALTNANRQQLGLGPVDDVYVSNDSDIHGTVLSHQVDKRKCKANQFKIVMLGAEGAGKSCTVDSLLGKPFNKDQPSTISAITQQVVVENNMTVDRVFVSNWKPLQILEYQKEVNKHYEYEVEASMNAGSYEGLNEMDEDKFLMKDKTTEVPTGQKFPIRIAIFDLGGQEVYYELQFLFLASLDVVFLTFDASKALDKPIIRRCRYTILQKEYKTREAQTTLEVIETALQTIHSKCGIESSNKEVCFYNPPVVLVATHAKLCKNKSATSDLLIEHLVKKKLTGHLLRNRIIFIDNEGKDELSQKTIVQLRDVAVYAATFAINEQRYLSYLKFESAIIERVSDKYISKQQAFMIAQDAGLEKDEEEFLKLLDYHTKRGIVLYYPEVDALKEIVFTSPQEVSDLVSIVIKIHEYTNLLSLLEPNDKCIRFDKYGLLEEDLFDNILEETGRSKDKNLILGFLQKFDLAIEIDRNTQFQIEDDYDSYSLPEKGRVFFVPAMLTYNKTEIYQVTSGYIDNVLLYYFPGKFLPDAFFSHSLVSTIKWFKDRHHRIRRVRHGVGVFDFDNNKQTFALQQCSRKCLIECHISVHYQELFNKELWYQRKELLLFLEQLMVDVHHLCIPKDKKPVAYLNCPFVHHDDCEPHLPYKAITTASVVCTKHSRPVSPEVFNLLMESTIISDNTAGLVRGAVHFIGKVQNRDEPPSMKEINRYVIRPHAPQWKYVGYELDLPHDTLAIIETNHPRDCVRCFEEALIKWLKMTPHATWKILEVAITNVRRNYLELDPVTSIYSES